MVTVEGLTPGDSFAGTLRVKVREVTWDPAPSRRAEVALVDTEGAPIRLVDYDGADNSVDWTPSHEYKISRCAVQHGGGGWELELAPSKRTVIEPLGTSGHETRLLVLGDTHVGRTTHPGTEERIDPVGAFESAVLYAIDTDVDAVVHVGDIFHDTATAFQAEAVDQNVFQPLIDADIPFYYIRGNHESGPGNAVLDDRDGTVAWNLDTNGVTIDSAVWLCGINHYPRGKLPWDEIVFPTTGREQASILVLHQTLTQLSGQGPQSVDLGQVTRRFSGHFDVILSGHHHDATVREWHGTRVMYTGAAEHMSTNADPTDRVAWLLTVSDGTVTCEQYKIP